MGLEKQREELAEYPMLAMESLEWSFGSGLLPFGPLAWVFGGILSESYVFFALRIFLHVFAFEFLHCFFTWFFLFFICLFL